MPLQSIGDAKLFGQGDYIFVGLEEMVIGDFQRGTLNMKITSQATWVFAGFKYFNGVPLLAEPIGSYQSCVAGANDGNMFFIYAHSGKYAFINTSNPLINIMVVPANSKKT